MPRRLAAAAYAEGITAGDRTLLARAITLVESRLPADRALAAEVLGLVLPRTGNARRVGVTGVPGVGKSTFIDAFGVFLTKLGHRVAVLAVDPTSRRTGGSILGDKTRMHRLAGDPGAYIRPSPAGTTLGGVARMTREAMLLCEAAGFDVVLVETVGVGQSETVVAEMVDLFLVLALPGAGDELQGIKKGILEVADLIAVNKADGEGRLRAEQAAGHYRRALHILEPQSPDWGVPVLLVSALEGAGLDTLWREIERHRAVMEASGAFAAKRRRQRVRWMWSLLEARLLDSFLEHPAVAGRLPGLEAEVAQGTLDPAGAVSRLLDAFSGGP
ncbi:MAG: methylmalonyl Co-A mutase-associated GTPase MeaB [Geminicoccaceae bacterium]|nr:methylmalonyl Co-A mutase-associated GTPase MeaB [Geminicoccaceae bacterium]